jgi:hypothetical protein
VRLEQALIKLQTERRVVLLHYSPIRQTCEGESPEVFPFLGSTRLEEPINRFRVSAVFHGHAHNGAVGGATATGIPRPQCLDAGIAKIRAKRVAFSHRGNLRCSGTPKTESK